MYLECDCSQISIEEWEEKMKGSRPINYKWLICRIRKNIPLLYKELCLNFYNPYEKQVQGEQTILHTSPLSYGIFHQEIT